MSKRNRKSQDKQEQLQIEGEAAAQVAQQEATALQEPPGPYVPKSFFAQMARATRSLLLQSEAAQVLNDILVMLNAGEAVVLKPDTIFHDRIARIVISTPHAPRIK